MTLSVAPRRSAVANAVYGVLNPIPFGCFVAALVFDLVYAKTGTMLWAKGAAWLIAFGLVFAVIPRLLNLVQVWITSRRLATGADHVDFWLNVVAIVAAVLNALVHTRDAYSIIPAGVWLSVVTVVLIAIGNVVIAVSASRRPEYAHG